ncbi:hypothetical protein M3Y97_00570700 [Aphelenchoides bicaudatus]|nr:hypothetical protein M3Y97_00570700 [Aphelenchoides bicaudatus]
MFWLVDQNLMMAKRLYVNMESLKVALFLFTAVEILDTVLTKKLLFMEVVHNSTVLLSIILMSTQSFCDPRFHAVSILVTILSTTSLHLMTQNQMSFTNSSMGTGPPRAPGQTGAQRVGFENAEDAVYGIECLIGEANATLKFDQEPGIQTCSYNVKVYERAKMIPSGQTKEKELSEVNTWILEEADAATDAFESILEPKKDIGSKKRKLSPSVYKEQSSSLPTDDRNIQPHIAELLEQITSKLSLSEVADLNYATQETIRHCCSVKRS